MDEVPSCAAVAAAAARAGDAVPGPVETAELLDVEVDPVLRSSTVSRLRHFATVFGLMPSSRLSAAVEACDRCIAARMAYVVVALP
jgi:hypothetical protein